MSFLENKNVYHREIKFETHSSMNGAACTFVSESCCEWGNLLLNRSTLVNISSDIQDGYVGSLLEF